MDILHLYTTPIYLIYYTSYHSNTSYSGTYHLTSMQLNNSTSTSHILPLLLSPINHASTHYLDAGDKWYIQHYNIPNTPIQPSTSNPAHSTKHTQPTHPTQHTQHTHPTQHTQPTHPTQHTQPTHSTNHSQHFRSFFTFLMKVRCSSTVNNGYRMLCCGHKPVIRLISSICFFVSMP